MIGVNKRIPAIDSDINKYKENTPVTQRNIGMIFENRWRQLKD
jgi:hypothetical protein